MGTTLWEQFTFWQNMKFDHTKYDVEQIACDKSSRQNDRYVS